MTEEFSAGGWLPSAPTMMTLPDDECIARLDADGVWRCVRPGHPDEGQPVEFKHVQMPPDTGRPA